MKVFGCRLWNLTRPGVGQARPKRFLLVQESPQERVTEVGLPGPAFAQDRHVLKPFVLADREGPEGFCLEDDVSHRVIPIKDLCGRREKHRRRLIGSGLKVLKTKNAEILLDLFAPFEIGDLIGLPNPVGLLPQKRFQVPAYLIDHPHEPLIRIRKDRSLHSRLPLWVDIPDLDRESSRRSFVVISDLDSESSFLRFRLSKSRIRLLLDIPSHLQFVVTGERRTRR